MTAGRLDRWLWTLDQRRILIIGLFCLIAVLTVRLVRNCESVPDPLPPDGPRAGELQSQFDLNTVDATTLSAVPRLGEIKARAIVDYRDRYVAAHPGKRAFEHVEDLLRVKGIGVGTVTSLRPFVMISTQPTSRPR